MMNAAILLQNCGRAFFVAHRSWCGVGFGLEVEATSEQTTAQGDGGGGGQRPTTNWKNRLMTVATRAQRGVTCQKGSHVKYGGRLGGGRHFWLCFGRFWVECLTL